MLIVLGSLAILIGAIWLVVAAFQESVLWGLAVLIFHGIASFIFLILHPEQAWRPIALEIVGVVLVMMGAAMTHH